MKTTIDALVEALEAEKAMRLYGQSPECGKENWESIRERRRAVYEATDAALAQARAEQAEPVRGVVIRDGLPTLVHIRDLILPTDKLLYTAAPVAKLEPPSRSEVVRIAMDTGLQSSDEHWGTVYRAVGPSNLEAFAAAIVEAAHNAKLGNK